jgi:MazG family protein
VSDAMSKLVSLMAMLRGPDGCPWDKEQTLKSLRTYLLEETYETLEAMESGCSDQICEELGDLLLEIVFITRICEEDGSFSLEDVASGIIDKLIRRHPHVFGDEKVDGSREAIGRWEAIKGEERISKGKKSVLDGVPPALPALLRAHRIADKASMVGFDWEKPEEALEKVEEEIIELREAIAAGDQRAIEEELGDLLFSVASVGRHLGNDPEAALQGANRKFTSRFKQVEEVLAERGKRPSSEHRQEMEMIWNQIKAQTGST